MKNLIKYIQNYVIARPLGRVNLLLLEKIENFRLLHFVRNDAHFKNLKINLIFIATIFVFVNFNFAKTFKIQNSYNLQSGAVNEYKLKNNISVFVNDSVSKDVDSIYIVVDGGSVLMKPEFSGLENSLFEMMTYGTKKFPYEKVNQLTYETKSSISHYSLYCGSVFSLNSINYYLDLMIPVFLDEFLNPAFENSSFELMQNDIKNALTRQQNSPMSITLKKIREESYKNTPLLTSTSVTEDSYKNLTIENLKNHHKKILDADRIKIVIVGKLDSKKLNKILTQLDSSIGNLKSLGNYIEEKNLAYEKIENFQNESQQNKIDLRGEKVSLTHKAANGSALLFRVFNSPSVKSDDYVAARITEDIFSTLMFNIIREKYGACYTPATQIDSNILPLGFDYGFKVSDLENFLSYLKEAQEVMKSGKVISSSKDNATGSATFEDLGAVLEGYKNSFLVKKYSSQSTSSGIASRIASSLLQFGDLTSSDKMISQVEQVSKDDVLRVFNEYWLTENCRWYEMK